MSMIFHHNNWQSVKTLPCAVKNKPPAHTNTPTSRILEENFYYLSTKENKHLLKLIILNGVKELSTTTSENAATPVF